MRVLVLNNYPLDAIGEEVRRGEKPDHHLYGLSQLQALGWDIRIVQAAEGKALRMLGGAMRRLRSPVPVGHLRRQSSAWRRLREADVIYAPCGGEVEGLAYLRALGLVRTPIVAIQHHTLNRGRLAPLREPWLRLQLRGTDTLATLSRTVAQEIASRTGEQHPAAPVLSWGPDARFYPRSDEPGEGALAAGRTGRDFITFGQAATRAGVHARIMCLGTDRSALFSSFGPRVKVDVPAGGRVYTYPDMMQAHLKARVLAIPLHASPHSLAGLTSLVDAVALGKPVICTRNRFLDLDVESLGIGRWVAPGDVDAWAEALLWFDRNPDESLAMGRRARALVEEGGYHSDAFARRVQALLEAAATT